MMLETIKLIEQERLKNDIRPASASFIAVLSRLGYDDIQSTKRQLNELIKQGKLFFYIDKDQRPHFYTNPENLY